MTRALLLQTSRWRDAADDAALTVLAGQLAPVSDVVAATADPVRTHRVTGLTSVGARLRTLLTLVPRMDALVVLGGRPLASGSRSEHLLGLQDLAVLATAFRGAGRQLALVGVSAGPLRTRPDALLARRLVLLSDLTVLDSGASAPHLTAVGVPTPLRVGADLAWLQMQEPPRRGQPDDRIWAPLTAAQVSLAGGAATVAATLAEVARAVERRIGVDPVVVVQAWRSGTAAGDDVDAATEIQTLLRSLGVTATLAAPAGTLTAERELLSSCRLCVSTDQHALMVAAALGVPLLAWPQDPAAATTAARLALPVLPAGDVTPLVDRALADSHATVPVVRRQVATAGEVVDLLRLLLSRGAEAPRHGAADPYQPSAFHDGRLRPTGVMR